MAAGNMWEQRRVMRWASFDTRQVSRVPNADFDEGARKQMVRKN